jgi:LacI family transcriptional regulator
MNLGRRPTLDDVAAQAGVSRSTVSRVINAHAYVTDEVRQAVLRAIDEIGYVPNASARALRTNRTMTVGLVVTRLRNQVFAAIAQSLDEALMAAGRTLLAGSSADDPKHEAHVVSAFLRRGIDGLVLTLVDERATALRRDLVGAGIPLVLLDRDARGLAADQVLCGHREGISAALDELRSYGHQRISLLTPPLTIRPGREVKASFVQLGGDPDLVRSGFLTEEFGHEATAELLALERRPSALIVSGTEVVVGALEAVRDLGLTIPEDLSMISYDDSPAARLYDPPISSLVRDPARMGAAAASMIIERLNGYAGPPRTVMLPTGFVRRGSVGPVAQGVRRGGRSGERAMAPA